MARVRIPSENQGRRSRSGAAGQILDISQRSRDRDRFIRFGWEMQRSIPHAIPNFLESEQALLDEQRNPFFRGGGRLKAFLALDRRDRIVGRIGAMINPAIAAEESLGLVGLFHCHEDDEVFGDLMDHATDWLRSQGCTVAWGPIDFSIWNRYRFAVDSFDSKPFIGEPRNPPHYPRFFEDYGFAKAFSWQSDLLDRAAIRQLVTRNRPHMTLFEQAGYRAVPAAEVDPDRLLDTVYDLIQVSYHRFPAFSKISRDEFADRVGPLQRLVDGKLSRLIENPTGKVVAFTLELKDRAEALRAMNGRTDLLAKLRFKLHRQRSNTANMYATGIRPEAVREAVVLGRKAGGSGLSIARAIGYQLGEAILSSDDYDDLMVTLMRSGSIGPNHSEDYAVRSRHYHLYGLSLR